MMVRNLAPYDRHEPRRANVPFFITGCPRSGTTLLQVLLNRHPSVVIPPELKLFFLYHHLPRVFRRQTLARIESECAVEGLSAWRRTDEIYRALAQRVSDRKLANSDEHVLLGDKTPEYAYRLHWVREVFPDSKLIFVVRDPRDVAPSLVRVPWLQCELAGAARLWTRTQRCLHVAEAEWNHPCLWVYYERLVREPMAVLTDVLSFLNLDSAPCTVSGMMQRSDQDQHVFPRREVTWKRRALQSPDRSRVQAWRRGSEADARRVEQQCYDEMCRLEYVPISDENPADWGSELAGRVGLMKTAWRLPAAVWVSEVCYRLRSVLPKVT